MLPQAELVSFYGVQIGASKENVAEPNDKLRPLRIAVQRHTKGANTLIVTVRFESGASGDYQPQRPTFESADANTRDTALAYSSKWIKRVVQITKKRCPS